MDGKANLLKQEVECMKMKECMNMKACIIQPPYSKDVSFSDEYFNYKLQQLNACDESMDIIVLPEYSDVPCATTTKEETVFYHKKYIDILHRFGL